MQIAPVYDRPIVNIEGGPAIVPARARQRRRLLDLFGSLTDDQWVSPSRCDDWRVQDVAAHVAGVDPFWTASVAAGLAGTPTEFLRGFDPKATPAAMVSAVGGRSPAETLADLSAATEAFCDLVEGLDESALAKVAESPPGHVAISDLLHHAFWDAWIHERDVALPLGLETPLERDEVLCSLRYAAALSPAFAVMSGTAADATLVLEATEPDARVVVSVTTEGVRVHDGAAPDAAIVIRGGAVELIEMLSARGPMTADVPDEYGWLVRSLSEVFEV